MEWRLTAAEDGSSAGGEAGVSFTQLPTGRTEAGAVVSAVEVTGSRDLDTVAIECRVTNRAGAGLRQMVAHRVGTSLSPYPGSRRFQNTEKSSTKAFSWLKAPTSAFTF